MAHALRKDCGKTVILEGNNTFPNLVQQYELGDHSAETISSLAKKYANQSIII